MVALYRSQKREKHMIRDITVGNFKAFSTPITVSFHSDMRTRRLSSNLIPFLGERIVKSLGIYGPNNTGKTCLIDAIQVIKDVMLGHQTFDKNPNLFSGDPVISFSISFSSSSSASEWFEYSFSFNCEKNTFEKEKLIAFSFDRYKNKKQRTVFVRDFAAREFSMFGHKSNDLIVAVSPSIPFLYCFNLSEDGNADILDCLAEFQSFANSLEVLRMYNIPISKTMEIMKGDDKASQKQISDFVKNADLFLDEFRYEPNQSLVTAIDNQGKKIGEGVLRSTPLADQIRLVSVYRGKQVPSLLFDSTGTKKIEALASYILDALKNGKTLIVDELDSGIHFKLTRAIVSLFNNPLNSSSQLLFTTHDINILDTKYLMRKEQIWFANKDEKGVKFYPLSDFHADAGIRESSDLLKHYNRGDFGAIPDPKLVDSLIEISKR